MSREINGPVKSVTVISNGIRQYTSNFDERGNEIYNICHTDGNWHECQYDEYNNCIHYKTSKGYEYWNDYNDKGKLVHHKEPTGVEYWLEYDEFGHEIKRRFKDGTEYISEYDDRGNEIHIVGNHSEVFMEYDKYGNIVKRTEIKSHSVSECVEVYEYYNDNIGGD
jgi:YD repeat-containing protein